MSFADAVSGISNVFLSNCFREIVENPDNIFLNNEDSIQEIGDNFSGVLTKSCLPQESQDTLSLLELLFSTRFNNYGKAFYNDNNELTAFNYPKVAKVNGEAYFVVGIDDEKLEYSRVLIPIKVKEVKIDDDGEEELEYRYFFEFNAKRIRCQLVTSTYNDNTYNYLAVKCKNSGGVTNVHIPFKLERTILDNKGVDPSSKIHQAWDSGRFLSILGNLRNTGVSISKCFKPAFLSEQFPSEGVLMVLSNPSIGELDLTNQGKGKLPTSRWNVEYVSCPELVVNGFKDGMQYPLGEVDFISTYASFNGYKFVSNHPEYLQKPNHYFWVHIVKPKANFDHIPNHVFTYSQKRLSMRVKKNFKNFIDLVTPMIENVVDAKQLSAQTPKALPQMKVVLEAEPKVATDAEIADSREALGFGESKGETIEVQAELVGASNSNGRAPDNDNHDSDSI